MNQEKLAEEIYAVVGPADNIKRAYNCMTRLRLFLVRQDAEMVSSIKKLDGVMGIHENGEELQVILGPGRAAAVSQKINEMLKQPAEQTATVTMAASKAKIGDGQELHAAIRKKNATPIKLLFKRIAGIFVP